MVVHVEACHIGRLVPSWFSRHLVVDELSVDAQSFEGDVLHFPLLVVALDDGDVRVVAFIADVAEGDVLYSPAWGGAVFGVVAYT